MRQSMLHACSLAVSLLALACDAPDPNAVLTQNTKSGTGASQPRVTPPIAAAPTPPSDTATRAYRDSDFVESEQNRDPFRSYADELRIKAPVVAQRLVLMPDTSVDEMKLIAIISGIEQPRAMIVDQRGVGYVTTRGDFVGKADVVQGGGSESLPVALNWRVDRIRVDEVVLAREDPSAPNRPPLTKVIPLHVEIEGSAIKG
jgi:type IV pilus assembly protein PilP